VAKRRRAEVRGVVSAETGAERSEAEVSADERRGRPGRRSVEDRAQAVLELLSGKAGVDQLARRFGVHPSTVERWRQDALEGISLALRQGTGKSPRELELEKRLKQVERAFTDVAIKKELLEKFLAERPTGPGKWSR
jgi:transposase-like protein